MNQKITHLLMTILLVSCGQSSSSLNPLPSSETHSSFPPNPSSNMSLNLSGNAVYAGGSTSFVVVNESSLYAWGQNQYGQLGIGNNESTYIPTRVELNDLENDTINMVSAGDHFTLLLTSSGVIYSWGRNHFGQLGLGHTTQSLFPQKLDLDFLLENEKAIQVLTASESFAFLLTNLGHVYSWGYGGKGALGTGNLNATVLTPQRVQFSTLEESDYIIQIQAGKEHALALSLEGRVFSWGQNVYGQLGNVSTQPAYEPVEVDFKYSLGGPSITSWGETIVHIFSRSFNSFAITNLGQIWGWGWGSGYQIGDGDNLERVYPRPIPMDALGVQEKFVLGYFGWSSSLVLTNQGNLFTWGNNDWGQLGDGTQIDQIVPTKLELNFLHQEEIASLAVGFFHMLILTTNGKVYGWGRNQAGQLGHSSLSYITTPTLINSSL